jgi:RHS repeat-associated protein
MFGNISNCQVIAFGNAENGCFWHYQNTDNQYRYNRKTAPNFTGKEKDPETGYSYFGARYLDHTLTTAWLSVDPMADKYPNISPYAYCAWNPVKLVDPKGEEIDDYFSHDGKYLGSDDAKTNNIRIISEMKWGMLKKNENGQIDHDIGLSLSISFSDASRQGMGINAQLRVYEHYNPTKYKVEDIPPEKNTPYPGMRTEVGCADKSSGKAVVTHLYIKLERNRSLNGCSEALCDNADEIVNAFVHEKDHIKRALEMGYYKWRDTVSTPEGHKDIEESAIAAQRAHDSWNGCRNSFKEGIRNYENTL